MPDAADGVIDLGKESVRRLNPRTARQARGLEPEAEAEDLAVDLESSKSTDRSVASAAVSNREGSNPGTIAPGAAQPNDGPVEDAMNQNGHQESADANGANGTNGADGASESRLSSLRTDREAFQASTEQRLSELAALARELRAGARDAAVSPSTTEATVEDKAKARTAEREAMERTRRAAAERAGRERKQRAPDLVRAEAPQAKDAEGARRQAEERAEAARQAAQEKQLALDAYAKQQEAVARQRELEAEQRKQAAAAKLASLAPEQIDLTSTEPGPTGPPASPTSNTVRFDADTLEIPVDASIDLYQARIVDVLAAGVAVGHTVTGGGIDSFAHGANSVDELRREIGPEVGDDWGNQRRVTAEDLVAQEHSSRSRWPMVGLGAFLGAAAAFALFAVFADRNNGAAEVAKADVQVTAVDVEQRDLLEEVEWEGALTHGENVIVVGSEGVVTSAAPAGTEILRGDVVAHVNEEPVVAMFGSRPLWRSLENGVEGIDVLQLETNLVLMGYDPLREIAVDETFTSQTAEIVKRWQRDVGREETGTIDPANVIMVAGPSVVKQAAIVGHPADGPLLGLSVRREVMGTPAVAPGPLTNLATVGTKVDHGTILYSVGGTKVIAAVNNDPVLDVVMRGEGASIEELEQALLDGGYNAENMAVDNLITESTRQAIRNWQQATGLPVTGNTEGPVFLRLEPEQTFEGQLPGRPDLDDDEQDTALIFVSRSEQKVEVVVPVADATKFSEGDPASIELSDETLVDAVVAKIGAVEDAAEPGEVPTVTITFAVREETAVAPAEPEEDDPFADEDEAEDAAESADADDQVTATTSLEVNVDGAEAEPVDEQDPADGEDPVDEDEQVEEPADSEDPSKGAFERQLIEGPATVTTIGDSVRNATAVPTRALVALAQGGFAVEVIEHGEVRLVGVELGTFDDGYVELVGSDLVPGDLVVVPT